jgi:hypothetical protein
MSVRKKTLYMILFSLRPTVSYLRTVVRQVEIRYPDMGDEERSLLAGLQDTYDDLSDRLDTLEALYGELQ